MPGMLVIEPLVPCTGEPRPPGPPVGDGDLDGDLPVLLPSPRSLELSDCSSALDENEIGTGSCREGLVLPAEGVAMGKVREGDEETVRGCVKS